MPDPDEPDSQDPAEVFDEENITEDGRDIATSDLQRDVYDATSAPEDADEALEPQDDFDPDQADEAELDEIVMAGDDLEEPRSFAAGDADLVADDDVSPADLEAGEGEPEAPGASESRNGRRA
ncbi:MAG TPA: primosomal protein [Caulobacteraceae bacterium]|nr:primosomal protein [Caulobacteraceae bacterium]